VKSNKDNKNLISRRSTLKGIGTISAFGLLNADTGYGKDETPTNNEVLNQPGDVRKTIFRNVFQTSFVDTHEHLPDEKDRLSSDYYSYGNRSDDWSIIFGLYLDSALQSAGMPDKNYRDFFSPAVDPLKKWTLLEPFWPSVKNTGDGQAVDIAIKQLYGVEELSAKTVKQVQAGYEQVRRPGFYKHILCDLAKIESCQVNSGDGFRQSATPLLLMQDIGIVGMFAGPNLEHYKKPTGINVTSLSDWHRVIDWWFDKYGKFAVAVKSQDAYERNIDYEMVPAEKTEPIFKKRLSEQPLTPQEKKTLEDHLFWYAVNKAAESNLPVKLHTGYYAIWGDKKPRMPLSRVSQNAAAATDLCRLSPQTRFVFMHICYPYYEEMISIAKHYPNAYVDMCWAWIINPLAAKDFLKKYLVTAPANKILTFGGDYSPVEPVLGHAVLARRGIALALSELAEEGWLSLDNAMDLVDPIMNGNAREIFSLSEKEKALKNLI
jgi:predicted TIM-barrel fold metal-dependent hydrolase